MQQHVMMVRATGWMSRRYMPQIDIHSSTEIFHLSFVSICFFSSIVTIDSKGYWRIFISVVKFERSHMGILDQSSSLLIYKATYKQKFSEAVQLRSHFLSQNFCLFDSYWSGHDGIKCADVP